MESRLLLNNSTELLFNQSIKCHDVNHLASVELQCQFVQTVSDCLEEDALFNYLEFAYCSVQSRFGATAYLLIWLLFLFVAIGITADDFLCPVLITISKSLKLSDNIAGVTFLAFGNGAPDIFSSLIGVNEDDSSLIIGELFGAGIFVTTVVVGSILLRTDFTIMKRPLLRDISFYLVTTGLVWGILYNGSIHLYNSLVYIAIYIVYVLVVVVSGYFYKTNLKKAQTTAAAARSMPQDRLEGKKKYQMQESEKGDNSKNKKIKLKTIMSKPPDDDEGVVLQKIIFRKYHTNPLRQRRFTIYQIGDDSNRTELPNDAKLASVYTLPQAGDNSNFDDNNNDSNYANHQHFKAIDMNNLNTRRVTLSDTNFKNANTIVADDKAGGGGDGDGGGGGATKKADYSPAALFNRARGYFAKREGTALKEAAQQACCGRIAWSRLGCFLLEVGNIEWSEFVKASIIAKALALIKAPVYILFTVTIPVVDLDLPMNGWHRGLTLLQCLIAPQLCLLLTGITLGNPWWCHSITLFISLFVVLPLITVTSRHDRPPVYHIVFAYLGFLMSVVMIYTIANEVVDILQSIGVIFNISKFLLGLTVLAWGNSIGDFISNLSMAKNGFPRMAISACFGGPVLNMLLGVGVPYTYLLARRSSATGSIGLEYSKWVTILYVTITVSLLSTIVFLVGVTRFRSSRMHAFWLYSIYVFFLVACALAEMNII